MRRLFVFAAALFAAIPLALSAADPAPPGSGVDLRMVDRVLSGPTKGTDINGTLPPDRVIDLRARADDAPKKDAAVKGRGHKAPSPEVRAKHHADAFKRHGHRVKHLPTVSAASFDCRTMGWVMPCDDQGQCGDCYGISAIDVCAMALVKAGRAPNAESSRWSGQYGLDSGAFDGGCDGGDEAQVFEYAKTKGFPLTSDYGPYTARPGRLKPVDPSKLVKIADWGYCANDQGQGVASVDDIKKCMVAYGVLSVAFDAGECDSYRWPQTMTGRGRSVDHAVAIVGWDDAHDNGDGSKGAFLGFNQWGSDWGSQGVFWIKYGADSWGTEAIWCVSALLPPPPPPPGPPVPPVPPGPGPNPPPAPVPGGAYTGTITTTIVKTYVNGAETGRTETTALGAPSASIESELKDAGVSPAIILDVLQLLSDLKTKPVDKNKVFADLLKIVMDLSASPTAAEKAGGCCGQPVGRREEPHPWTLAA